MAVNIIEGVNSYIADTVKIIGAGNITIGNNVQIRDYTVIELGAGNITIGNDVVIGYIHLYNVQVQLILVTML